MKRFNQIQFRKLSLLIVGIFMVSTVWAQQSIKGKVVDTDGQPLAGVIVVVQETNVGTATDAEGQYTISAKADGVLKISFVGMLTKIEPINGRSEINVTMEMDMIGIEEVVVVGYGTMKKSDLTGSVMSVGSKQFEYQPLVKMDQALQGRAAGVTVTQISGQPGSDMKIRIRGANSISGNNNPLYVIDGMVASDIGSLNVDDIQSMEILKDASATAIYGSRGANGVILITTKKGVKGKPTINLETFHGLSTIIQKLPMLTPSDYAEGVNFMEKAEIFTPAEIEALKQPGAGVDAQDEFFQTAPSHTYKMSLGGGTDAFDYFVSGSIYNADGTIINQNYKRYTLRANINAKVSDKITFGLNISGSREENTGVRANLSSGLTWDMTTPFYNANGGYNYTTLKPSVGNGERNPIMAPMENISDNFQNHVNASSYFNMELLKGLVLNISGGVDWMNSINSAYQPIEISQIGTAQVYNNNVALLQNVNRLTYTFERGNHRLQADAINEQQLSSVTFLNADASGFFTDATTYKNLALAELQLIDNSIIKSSLLSFLGRINYSFANKYLLTASFRADGSSKFREGNQWGYFPSGSFAWRVSEESFLQDVKKISDLKIRISYGETGSQAIEALATRSRAVIGPENNYPYTGGTGKIGAAPSERLANPYLTWESTAQADIGIDLGMWENKVTMSFDLYKKNTTNLLLDVILPGFVGPTVVTQNVGEMENKGFEFVLGWKAFNKGDWSVSNTVTFNRNVNTVIALVDGEPIEKGESYIGQYAPVNPTRLEVGESMGAFRGYEFLGVWQLGEEAEAAKYGRAPGDAKYLDLNGDFNYTTEDITIVGNGNPDFTFGLNGNVSWKNLGLDYLFTGSVGNDIYNFQRGRMMSLAASTFHASHADYLNRWTPTNPSNIPSTRDNTEVLSSQFVEDGSYFSLKNISLSYTFKNIAAFNAIGLDALRIYGSIENLFIMTDYRGYDPESTASGNSDVDLGIDLNTYPLARTFIAGVKFTF